MKCVDESFKNKDYEQENTILREEALSWKIFGSGYYPSVVINNRTMRGDINPDTVMRVICSGSKILTKPCAEFNDPNPIIVLETGNEGITLNQLIALVVVLVFVNLMFICLYKRCTNKDV